MDRELINELMKIKDKFNEESKASNDRADYLGTNIKNVAQGIDYLTTTLVPKVEQLLEEMELSNNIALSNNQSLPAEIREQATNQVVDILTRRAQIQATAAKFK